MPPLSLPTGLTITNPLVLYRTLLATKRIDPDPAQYRLALHLQKLYYRLKDYEPEVEYRQKLEQISRSFGKSSTLDPQAQDDQIGSLHATGEQRSRVFSLFKKEKARSDALALTRRLTSHESAIHLHSPRGLLLYGEVGTGKSMLIDLLMDSLPNRKKRRWHFNTFMLETFARLEHLRKDRLTISSNVEGKDGLDEEHSLLWLAREMVTTTPILFMDEFQLPDRAASKILSNLFTAFFQLGGVLVATSNRMPEELANASGIEYSPPPSSRSGFFGHKWGLLRSKAAAETGNKLFSGKGDFASFLEVLRARCEVWDMEGAKDWRRQEVEEERNRNHWDTKAERPSSKFSQGWDGLETLTTENWGLGYEQNRQLDSERNAIDKSNRLLETILPKHYHIISKFSSENSTNGEESEWENALLKAVSHATSALPSQGAIPWKPCYLRVYGRDVLVPRFYDRVTMWTFRELCSINLGPADYISLASKFHTVILVDVPILSLLQKNEARRFITLLDALYEARCKILIRAEAGPDDIFFPETRSNRGERQDGSNSSDSVYSEVFSDIYQDQTSPFRPNTSSYTSSSSTPSYALAPLPSDPHIFSSSNVSTRSVLADEDSDFGPVYGSGRSSNFDSYHRADERDNRGPSDGLPGAGNEIGRQEGLNFSKTGIFTGEDERFAYRRARSRIWEMCGRRWWERQEEGWWRPVGPEIRRWEVDAGKHASIESSEVSMGRDSASQSQENEQKLFRHGASPFRTMLEPPPKFAWVHAWGMMKWGKKAGAWGQGPEGLGEKGATSESKKVFKTEAFEKTS